MAFTKLYQLCFTFLDSFKGWIIDLPVLLHYRQPGKDVSSAWIFFPDYFSPASSTIRHILAVNIQTTSFSCYVLLCTLFIFNHYYWWAYSIFWPLPKGLGLICVVLLLVFVITQVSLLYFNAYLNIFFILPLSKMLNSWQIKHCTSLNKRKVISISGLHLFSSNVHHLGLL